MQKTNQLATLPTIVIKILELINQHGISKLQVERESGIAKSSIYNWENKIAKPNIEAIIKLASYFNVSADYLLGLEPPKQEKLIPKDITTMWFQLNEKEQNFIRGNMEQIIEMKK